VLLRVISWIVIIFQQPARTEALTKRNYIYAYPFALLACWVAAWLVYTRLTFLSANAGAATGYWIAAKVVIWVAPVFVLISLVEEPRWPQFLELVNPLKGLLVGFLISLLLIALFYFFEQIFDRTRHLAFPVLSLALLNGVIVAPLVEEIVFRGFYLRKLRLNGVGFWVANGITTIFFVGMHLPGWYFQRKLQAGSMPSAIGSLAFFSLLLGLVKVKSRTLYATIVIHMLNNLYSLAR
jgi:membrane protease YdiL (CAAX protease family)